MMHFTTPPPQKAETSADHSYDPALAPHGIYFRGKAIRTLQRTEARFTSPPERTPGQMRAGERGQLFTVAHLWGGGSLDSGSLT